MFPLANPGKVPNKKKTSLSVMFSGRLLAHSVFTSVSRVAGFPPVLPAAGASEFIVPLFFSSTFLAPME